MRPAVREAIVAEVLRRVREQAPHLDTIRGVASASGCRTFLVFDLHEHVVGYRAYRASSEAWSRPPIGALSIWWEPGRGIDLREQTTPPPGYTERLLCEQVGSGPCNGGRYEIERFTAALTSACVMRLRPVPGTDVLAQLREGEVYERGDVRIPHGSDL